MPIVIKNDVMWCLLIFTHAIYITNPSVIDNSTVKIYIAVNPPIPIFSPSWYTKYVPTSYNQCGYVYSKSSCHEKWSFISIVPVSTMSFPIAIV